MAEVQKKAEWSKLVNNNPQSRIYRSLRLRIPFETSRRSEPGNGGAARGSGAGGQGVGWEGQKISHRHRKESSSSSSRTWRAKTVEESSKKQKGTLPLTAQLIATVCVCVFFFLFSNFSFTVYLKTSLSTVKRKKKTTEEESEEVVMYTAVFGKMSPHLHRKRPSVNSGGFCCAVTCGPSRSAAGSERC